ncbi:MAG: aspartyl protease family protein [Thermofilum sp.]|nr:aspartyl protease family protein [Thermofilum sp.]
MRIPCYFDPRFEPPAPFVRVTVDLKSLNIRGTIYFLIDTGASTTVLLDKDVNFLGIDVRRLKRAERDIGGIGGLISTYVVEDASLFFRAEDGGVVEEKLQLLVGRHDLSGLSYIERALIMRLPSLLGRDVIYRFKLVCDRYHNEVFLER